MIWLQWNRRVWLLTGLGALLILVGGAFLLSRAIETALRTATNAYLSERTLTLYNNENPSGIVVVVPYLRLSLLRRRLELREVKIRYDQKKNGRYVRFEADAPTIVLTGLDLSDAIWHSSFHLSGVTLHNPHIVRLDEGPVDSDSTKARQASDDQAEQVFEAARAAQGHAPSSLIPAPDSLLYSVIAAWLPDEVRGGRIERITVDGATLSSRVVRGKAVTTDSTEGLSLTIKGIQLDSTEHRVFEWGTLSVDKFIHATPGRGDSVLVDGTILTIAEGDTAFRVDHAWIAPEGPGHALHAHGISRSQAQRSLTIDSARYGPEIPDTTFFRLASPHSTRHRLEAFGLRVRGVDQSEVRKRQLTPTAIEIDSLDVDILSDQRGPPKPPRAKVLWPQQLDAVEWVTGVDSIIVKAGDIRYGELKDGQPQPGVVRFSHVRGTVTNATNDSTRSGPGSPSVIDAQGNLFDAGVLKARIEVAVAPGPIQLRAEGHLGPMPIAAFNKFVLVANGIHITDGQVHEADFFFAVKNGVADGQLRPRFENFNIELVDKVTRKQSFGKKLKSMIAGIMMRSANMPDKKGKLKSAPIHYQLEVGETFWGLLWHSARTGVVRSLKE